MQEEAFDAHDDSLGDNRRLVQAPFGPRAPQNLSLRERIIGTTSVGFAPRLKKAQLFLIGLGVIYLLGTQFFGGQDNFYFNFYFTYFVEIFAVGLCFARAFLIRDKESKAWFVLATAMSIWIGGDMAWTIVYGSLDDPPAVSFADICWLGFYPITYGAVIMLVRTRMQRVPRSVWLDGLIGGFAAASLSAAFFFRPIEQAASGSMLSVAVSLAYPCADFLLLSLVFCSFALSGWRPDKSWILLGLALLALSLADTLYLYTNAIGTYQQGSLMDAGWTTAMILIALSAWRRPKRVDTLVFQSWTVVVIPIFFSFSSLMILAGFSFLNGPPLAKVLAVCAIVAGFIRMALTFKEVRVLSESRREARTDELTSLGNRRMFYESLGSMLERRPDDKPLALLLIDLDRFKEVNDSLGHQFGDKLLQQVGPRLRALMRNEDVVARLGGDEFSIIIDNVTTDVAIEAASRVQEALTRPFELDGVPVQIGASIGVALFPEHGSDPSNLLRHADVAMYKAKEERGKSFLYEPEQDNHSRDRLNTINELRNALDEDRVIVHYQPKLTSDGRSAGAEALVRMRNSAGDIVPPDQFLPLAEQSGLMKVFTERVIEIVLKDISNWRQGGRDVKVAVNLSVSNLMDAAFPNYVHDMLQNFNVPGTRLAFEITETTVLTDPDRAIVAIERLRELGCRISLDDYGTGYASIAYLRQMPLDELKLDRSFVKNLESDEVARSFFVSTVTLAHVLGLDVVAEGVETPGMWNAVRAAGCNIGQGFLFSRPVPEEHFLAAVDNMLDAEATNYSVI